MSPVLNHPSGVIAFFVAVGLLRYPFKSGQRQTEAEDKETYFHHRRPANPQFARRSLRRVLQPIFVLDQTSLEVREENTDAADFAVRKFAGKDMRRWGGFREAVTCCGWV